MGLNKDLYLFIRVSPFILLFTSQSTLKDSSVKNVNKLPWGELRSLMGAS